MGVIALNSKWTSFSTIEKSTHDSLVLARVGRRDSQASLVIYQHLLRSRWRRCRRWWCVCLDRLAPSFYCRSRSGLSFGRCIIFVVVGLVVALIILGCGCGCFNFANFLHWSISGSRGCRRRQNELVWAGSDPARRQGFLLSGPWTTAPILLEDASLKGFDREVRYDFVWIRVVIGTRAGLRCATRKSAARYIDAAGALSNSWVSVGSHGIGDAEVVGIRLARCWHAGCIAHHVILFCGFGPPRLLNLFCLRTLMFSHLLRYIYPSCLQI